MIQSKWAGLPAPLAVLFFSLFMLAAFGCSTMEPRDKYVAAQEAFIVASTIAVEAKQAGRISQEDWDTVYLPAIQEGDRLLDKMKAMLEAGNYSELNLAVSAMFAVLAQLEQDQ